MDPNLFFGGFIWLWTAFVPAASYLQPAGPCEVPYSRAFRSAHFSVDGKLEAGRQTVGIRGQGAFVAPDRIQMSLSIDGQQFEQIVIGNDQWVRNSSSGPWRKTTVGATAPPTGQPPGGPRTTTQPTSPDDVLRALKDFRLVGQTELRDAQVCHYAGEIDLARLSRSDPELFKGTKLTFELWTGVADGYLHQFRIVFEYNPPPSATASTPRVIFDFTVGFFDFDQDIQILPHDIRPQPSPSPAPSPTPSAAPAQLPRSPSRLPNTGDGESSAPWALGAGLSTLAAGLTLLRRRPWVARGARTDNGNREK